MSGGGGVTLLRVLVTPCAGRDGIAGYNPWRRRLSVRVRAPPRGGEANRALVRLLASALGVSKGDVKIVKGVNSREKTLRINLPRERVLEALGSHEPERV
ncbi:MAG: YggU family protein [Euryarchaeota archaeon]|nr:YggU family protein [Euryarchaeota archaeon]